MKTFFIIIGIIYLALNAYIFFRGWQALPASPGMRCSYIIIFACFALAFPVAMGTRDILPIEVLKIFYTIGTTWLACIFYFLMLYLVTDLIFLSNKLFHFLPEKWVSGYRFLQVVFSSLTVLILLIVGYVRFNHPAVEEINIKIDKQAGSRKELRVVGISDIHLGLSVDKARLSRYVDKINSLQPDMIIIAGDIIDNSVRVLNAEHLEDELNRLKAPLGVYSCLGNHEYISGVEESLAFLKKTNIRLLIDEVKLIDNSLYVAGRDDRMNPRRMPLDSLLKDVNPSLPIILLDHQPYFLEQAESNGVDLQFSGHTHNGQLWPGNLIVEKIYEVGYGYKQKGNTHVYVSSGLALWGPMFRIGTQSEAVVFNIRFQ